jgi:hypothetical protein
MRGRLVLVLVEAGVSGTRAEALACHPERASRERGPRRPLVVRSAVADLRGLRCTRQSGSSPRSAPCQAARCERKCSKEGERDEPDTVTLDPPRVRRE